MACAFACLIDDNVKYEIPISGWLTAMLVPSKTILRDVLFDIYGTLAWAKWITNKFLLLRVVLQADASCFSSALPVILRSPEEPRGHLGMLQVVFENTSGIDLQTRCN